MNKKENRMAVRQAAQQAVIRDEQEPPASNMRLPIRLRRF